MRIPKAAVALVLAVIGTCAVRAPVAYGIDYSWANPVSGSLLDPTKWSPNGVPSLIDTAIFNLGSTGYIRWTPIVGQFLGLDKM
ncbi:MAG TPA: hypothetical protein VHD36_16750 [Pirellulales bacterium]|nr:hypothetical protein [Pirellulales bacterium]